MIISSFSTYFLSYFKKYPFEEPLNKIARRIKILKTEYENSGNLNTTLEKKKVYETIKNQNFLETNFHNITIDIIDAKKVLYHWQDEDTFYMPGGYIDFIDNNNIIGTNGKGEFFSLDIVNKRFNSIKSNLNQIYKSQNYSGSVAKHLFGRFGPRDIYIDRDKNKIYASINLFNEKENCYGIGLFSASLNTETIDIKKDILNFKELFRTKPCTKKFKGHASGGRIKTLKDNIIFTVGSLDYGLYENTSVPESFENALGKVISINNNGNYEIISKGHRNQQGLFVLKNEIFITEHGPKGGDEINLISQKKHYGWPYFAYGFDYDDRKKFRLRHKEGYEKPIYYFTPSIGISELVFYKNKEFKYWKNKFIVTSLKDKSIYIMDYDIIKKRIISSEKIPINYRLRDILVLPKGEIVLITDEQKIIILRNSNFDVYTSDSILVPLPR